MLWRIEHTQVGVYTLVLSVYGALPWRCLVYHTACLPVRPDCKKGITQLDAQLNLTRPSTTTERPTDQTRRVCAEYSQLAIGGEYGTLTGTETDARTRPTRAN